MSDAETMLFLVATCLLLLLVVASILIAQQVTMGSIQDTIDIIKADVSDVATKLDAFIATHTAGEIVTDQERADLQGIADALKAVDTKLTPSDLVPPAA